MVRKLKMALQVKEIITTVTRIVVGQILGGGEVWGNNGGDSTGRRQGDRILMLRQTECARGGTQKRN